MDKYICNCGELFSGEKTKDEHLFYNKTHKSVIFTPLGYRLTIKDKILNFLEINIIVLLRLFGLIIINTLIMNHFNLTIKEGVLLGLGTGFLLRIKD